MQWNLELMLKIHTKLYAFPGQITQYLAPGGFGQELNLHVIIYNSSILRFYGCKTHCSEPTRDEAIMTGLRIRRIPY